MMNAADQKSVVGGDHRLLLHLNRSRHYGWRHHAETKRAVYDHADADDSVEMAIRAVLMNLLPEELILC
jgi:hypothetical protein